MHAQGVEGDWYETSASSASGTTCPDCDQSFDKQTMRRHLRRHLPGQRPFKCWMCGFDSLRKDSLRSHCLRKHDMAEEAFKEAQRTGARKKEERRANVI